jgi:type I restriction enzyme S subunit
MNHTLKPYPAYKDSGVPWLGEVPEHWPVMPNRALFAEMKERNCSDEQMLSVTIAKGVLRQADLLANSSKKDSSNENKTNYKLVKPGDIAYNKMRAWQGAVGVSDYQGIVSPAYVVVRPRDEQNPRYFHYLLRTPAFAKEAERWSYGITSDQWSLRAEDFKQIYCSLPPTDEQSAIVRFLDRAELRIRRYIRLKRQMIGLLNEQKQAIIHHAVTRGLNPGVRFKPSGVEWLGDVPEHWEVWQIGHLAKVGNGSTPSRGNQAYWIGGIYPWLNSSCTNLSYISNANQFVTNLALRECHLPKVQPGSVLVAITGQGRTRGKAAVLGFEATINQHIAYITPRQKMMSSEYLSLFLFGAYSQLRAISDDSGSTKGALTCQDLKHFKVTLPPESEQISIVHGIQTKTSQLESTIDRAQREIDLIREYRTRLITDVVTGKLDVRGVAVEAIEAELGELLDADEMDPEEMGDEMGEAAESVE